MNLVRCEGCVSGPTSPDFNTCPWPPGPDTTTRSTTTIRTTPTTATKSTTKTTPTTTTQTTTKATPTTSGGSCEDMVWGATCSWHHSDGLLEDWSHIEAGDCQAVCRDLPQAKFFSSYKVKSYLFFSSDEWFCCIQSSDDLRDGGKTKCGCFSECQPTTKHCHTSCGGDRHCTL